MTKSRQDSTKVAILYFNLNNFSKLKGQFGFSTAELLLKSLISNISQSCNTNCYFSRVNDYEYIAIIPDLLHRHHINRVIDNLNNTLSEPVTFNQYLVRLDVSFGISIYPDNDTNIFTLKANAYFALQKAMENGWSSYTFYEEKQRDDQHRHFKIEQCLNSVVSKGELSVLLQPRLSTLNGHINCIEALVRWSSPELGFISPATFIPYAEESGLIHSISEWIYREAFKQLKDIHNQGFNHLKVSINVSPNQIYAQTIKPCLAKLIDEIGIDPTLVELEITEGILLKANSKTTNTLKDLREMGFKLAIDDFGTGYSSLSFLSNFPVDTLKIDRKFIEQLPYSNSYFNIVKAIIELSDSLNLNCVAEGVETYAQFQCLKELDCLLIQGNFYSGPINKFKLLKLLKDQEMHLNLI